MPPSFFGDAMISRKHVFKVEAFLALGWNAKLVEPHLPRILNNTLKLVVGKAI